GSDRRPPLPRLPTPPRRRHRRGREPSAPMNLPLLSVTVPREGGGVLARQRPRAITRLLGFDVQDQTRLATATSEIARNAFEYAKGGQVDFVLEGRTPPQIPLV